MIDEKKKAKIRKMSSEGRSTSEIAEKVKVDPKTVRKYAKEENNEKEKKPMVVNEGMKEPANAESRGKLAGKLFEMFSKGMKPEQVVVKAQEPPEVVLEFHKKWLELKEAGTTKIQSIEAITLKAIISKLRSDLSALYDKLNRIEGTLANTPLNGFRYQFECPHCKGRGGLLLPVKCPKCDVVSFWGWP